MNREHILERKKKWRMENKELVSRHNKTHYERNPEFHAKRRAERKNCGEKWRKYGRDRYEKNREKLVEYARAWRKKNPEKYRISYRASRIKSKYGMSMEQYDAMIIAQHGRCASCNEVPSGRGLSGVLHLDHCHATGKVRAMLCYRCNLALGLLNDDKSKLASLIEYLGRNCAIQGS